MATFADIDAFFDRLQNDFLKKAAARVVAETATEYYKERFKYKDWEGNPWPPVKNPVKRGTLMLRSGGLRNSITPSLISSNKVVISAGSSRIPYAQIHNEGGNITVPVTKKMRKFAWAMHYKTSKDKKAYTAWKGLAITSKNALNIHMPKRQFMGYSNELNNRIVKRLDMAFNKL
jgi:phage gpG-like protein